MPDFSIDFIWWITVVDIPALAGLFWMIWRTRKDHDVANQHLRDVIETRNSQLREALSAFKLEVAKTYAAISDLKDLENRLVGHLLRIESKLDVTALKTEALKAKK
ncbi:MAG: hypothetical protein ACXW4B_11005 [Micavibrio sp.]